MTTEELNLKSRVEYLENEIKIHIVNERAWIERCEQAESSLEKEEQAHMMSVYDLNMKIAEIGIALEKEKEKIEKLRQRLDLEKLSYNGMEQLLIKERGRIKKFETVDTRHGIRLVDRLEHSEKQLEAERISVNELSLANQELVAKVKELDDRIVSLVILADGYAMRITKAESRLKELKEAVEKHKEKHDKTSVFKIPFSDEELYKVLEEVKSDLKDYQPNLLVEQLSERIKELELELEKTTKHYVATLEDWNTERDYDRSLIKELEAQLASIKADENIGKLIE